MLEVRRYACEKRIFLERCNNFTQPYSNRTSKASEYLKKFLIEISSNKDAYFSKILIIPVSNNTCLMIVKSRAMPTNNKLICIGIYD